MAWNSDPMVRDLATYCNKHKFPVGIFWGIAQNGEQCQLVTFGRTVALCEQAKDIGNKVIEDIFTEEKAEQKDR